MGNASFQVTAIESNLGVRVKNIPSVCNLFSLAYSSKILESAVLMESILSGFEK